MSDPYNFQYNQPDRRPPSRRGPILMMVLGGLMMVLGPIIGLAMSVMNVMNRVDDSALQNAQMIANPGSVTLQPGQWVVFTNAAGGDFSCSVATSGNQPIATTNMQGTIESFSLGAADTVTIDCTTGQDLYLLDAAVFNSIAGDAAGIAGPTLLGFGAGGIGFFMLLAGIIWFIAAGRKIREAEAGGYGGGGYGSGGYGTGGFGPGGRGSAGSASYGTPGSDPYRADPYGGAGTDPYRRDPGTPPSGPAYGQRPEDPPRYGERLDP
ncbi:MAG: hypothetical protein Q4G64_06170 [bacterium]|nr:hypothetical protein [bacterium]